MTIKLRDVIDQLNSGLTTNSKTLYGALNSIQRQCVGLSYASEVLSAGEFDVLQRFMRICEDQQRWRDLGFTREPDFEADEITRSPRGDTVTLTGDLA